MSGFNASFSRRPANKAPQASALSSSLLGEPPISRTPGRQQPLQGFGGGYGSNDSNYRQDINSFEEEYDAMMEEFGEYQNNAPSAGRAQQQRAGGSTGKPQQLFDIDFNETGDFDQRGGSGRWGGGGGSQGSSGRRQNEFNTMESTGRGGSGIPSWTTNSEIREFDTDVGGRQGNASTSVGQFGQSNMMQNLNNNSQLQALLNQLSQQNQLGNQSANNLLGMVQGLNPGAAHNALNLLQQQAAAAALANTNQLLLGNLPAFNAEAFGKQILNAAAAATGGTPFGQGVGSQMPPPLMGNSFNPRAFDRSSDRSARERSPRRSRDVGRGNDQRVDRKRLGDRFDDSDRKRVRGRDQDRVLRKSIGNSSGGGRNFSNRNRQSESGKDKPDEKVKPKSTEESNVGAKGEAAAEGEEGKAMEVDKNEDTTEEKKSKFDQFPASLLVCKVCQKTMKDGSSFESHLSGRAHVSLLDIMKERFNKRSDLLMAESRYSEEEVSIELERQKRAGKGGGGSANKNKNYCKMCDCNYYKNWGAHKQGINHRSLKEFLHPTCRVCEVEFGHRMDWVNHLYTTSHFRKLAELKEGGKNVEEYESPWQDLLFTLSIEIGQDEHMPNCITVRNLDWKVPSKDDLNDLLQDDLDIPEGEMIIPEKYDETVAVGKEAIVTTVGNCCKVCKIYLTREKDVESHLKDKSHFSMCWQYLRKVERIRKAKEKGEQENGVEEEQEDGRQNEDETGDVGDHENTDQGQDMKSFDNSGTDNQDHDGMAEEKLQDSDLTLEDSKFNTSGDLLAPDADAEDGSESQNVDLKMDQGDGIKEEQVECVTAQNDGENVDEAQNENKNADVPANDNSQLKAEPVVELKPVTIPPKTPVASRGAAQNSKPATAIRARGRGVGAARGTPSRGNAATPRGGRGNQGGPRGNFSRGAMSRR